MRSLPRLLLVEDDPVSREFLHAALEALPAVVSSAIDVAGGQRLAEARTFDLWLFDIHLGSERGEDLLAALRAQGMVTPAVALTADHRVETVARLRAAGFDDVFQKPLSASALRARAQAWLGRSVADAGRAWNDDRALATAGGNVDTVRALRKLFREELPDQLRQLRLARARDDHAAQRAILHRMKASCGFVGAGALLEATRFLHHDPGSAAAWASFEAACRELLASPED